MNAPEYFLMLGQQVMGHVQLIDSGIGVIQTTDPRFKDGTLYSFDSSEGKALLSDFTWVTPGLDRNTTGSFVVDSEGEVLNVVSPEGKVVDFLYLDPANMKFRSAKGRKLQDVWAHGRSSDERDFGTVDEWQWSLSTQGLSVEVRNERTDVHS